MFQWRVTKYNPMYRDESGAYKKNEWTAVSDIGREYQLTAGGYLDVENKYVDAVIAFMAYQNLGTLVVSGLEIKDTFYEEIKKMYPELYFFGMDNVWKTVKEGEEINRAEVQIICRLALRENLWCRLISPDGKLFVHFGYDYYMYIGSSEKCEGAVEKIRKSGLFVEEFESPYHPEVN